MAPAIYSEMAAHRSPYVWLDISHQGSDFVEHHFPNLVELTRRYGFDLSRTRLPVSPAAHYTCGGVAAGLQQLDILHDVPTGLLPYGQALRARNIHDAAYLILHSAMLRKESRGGHFNTDYPAKATPTVTAVPGVYQHCWMHTESSATPAEAFLHA